MNGVIVRYTGACLMATLITVLVGAQESAAQGRIHAYPRAGQSQAQQRLDKFECHQWAVQETGFDPISAAPPPRHADTEDDRGSSTGFLGIGGDRNLAGGEGTVLSDAATGAAIGAAGGAIAGDAGLGAAVGAGLSAILGDIARSNAESKRRRSRPAEPDYHAQLADYQQAYGVCLSARDYQVS